MPAVMKHFTNIETLQFTSISDNNFELLSTIQWSTQDSREPMKVQEDFFSLRLPPPHYTPATNKRQGKFVTITDPSKGALPPRMLSIQIEQKKSNDKPKPKTIKKKELEIYQSKSVDNNERNEASKPYSQYIEETIIQQHELS
jgi:hypothetical protein